MFAKGKNSLQAEIDIQKAVLYEMIERFPNLIKDEIARYENLLNTEAKEAADGDTDIEMSYIRNSPYNDVIDFRYNVLLYHYYSLCLMIYAYAESTISTISERENPCKGKIKGNYLEGHYNRIRSKYSKLPKLNKMWEERSSFQKKRNLIAHKLRMQDMGEMQNYLKYNLQCAYNLLCIVVNEINKPK